MVSPSETLPEANSWMMNFKISKWGYSTMITGYLWLEMTNINMNCK